MFWTIFTVVSFLLVIIWVFALFSIIRMLAIDHENGGEESGNSKKIKKLIEKRFGSPINWYSFVEYMITTNIIMVIPYVNVCFLLCALIMSLLKKD